MTGWIKRLLENINGTKTNMVSNHAFKKEYYEILMLTEDEAKQRFLDGVNKHRFAVEYSTATDFSTLSHLPHTVRDLFSNIAKVEVGATGATIDRASFELPGRYPGIGFLGVGVNLEVILFKPGMNGIFVLDEGDTLEDLAEPVYPSIYHWLLCEAIE